MIVNWPQSISYPLDADAVVGCVGVLVHSHCFAVFVQLEANLWQSNSYWNCFVFINVIFFINIYTCYLFRVFHQQHHHYHYLIHFDSLSSNLIEGASWLLIRISVSVATLKIHSFITQWNALMKWNGLQWDALLLLFWWCFLCFFLVSLSI